MISANEAREIKNKTNGDRFMAEAEKAIEKSANSGNSYARIEWNIETVPKIVIEELEALGYKVKGYKQQYYTDEIHYVEISWWDKKENNNE